MPSHCTCICAIRHTDMISKHFSFSCNCSKALDQNMPILKVVISV